MVSLLLVHAAATLFMLGVIVVMQVVHYPLFALVGSSSFALYQRSHMRLVTIVVVPAMLIELVTGVLLLWWAPPVISGWLTGLGVVLIALIWASTGLVQARIHQRLMNAFDAGLHRQLVKTNWMRTLAWAARSILVLGMLYTVISAGS